MFYERREQTPREWMRRVKQSLTYITPNFDCRRMVREYMSELYEPAHTQHMRMLRGRLQPAAREGAVGIRGFAKSGIVSGLSIAGAGPAATVISGKPLPVRAAIELAGPGTG